MIHYYTVIRPAHFRKQEELFGQMMHGTVHVTHKLPQFRLMDPRLRSYSSETLQVPISRTRAYEFSFYLNVTTMWNALPLDVTSSSSLLTFKRHLNSFFVLFCFCFVFLCVCFCSVISLCTCVHVGGIIASLLCYFMSPCFLQNFHI